MKGSARIGRWKYALPALMLFLSFMMFSKFRYPSFKAVNWRTTRSIPRFFFLIALLAVTVKFYQWMAAVIFLSYLLYGFLRPFLSPKRPSRNRRGNRRGTGRETRRSRKIP